MKTLVVCLAALLVSACAHETKTALDSPSVKELGAHRDAEMRSEIARYRSLGADGFVADCRQKGEWRFLSCRISAGHLTTFPGLTRSEVDQFISLEKHPFDCIDDMSTIDGIFGESLELRNELRSVHEAYATRVNQAVVSEIRKERQPNQALQTTSVTRSGFEKDPVSDRQRRGV